MRHTSIHSAHQRPGVVLLVVMAMLALFASVALSFVFYADSEAVAAQMNRSAMAPDQPDVDPELLAALFLNQMIYDTDNVYSALRGWSLARSIYGYNPAALNFTPFNSPGRASINYPTVFGGSNVDNNLINYQKFSMPAWNNTTTYVVGNMVTNGGNAYACIVANTNQAPPNVAYWSPILDPLLSMDRTPEFYGKIGDANYRYIGGANPPWTAYDTSNLWLAQVMADGTVLMPSFSRPWITSGIVAGSPSAKYMSMRPDPVWNPTFAAALVDSDTALGPDVRNLEFGPGMAKPGGGYYNNDSNWIDPGGPIFTAPNGTRYKALVAPLVVDLSNRLNLWAHGNRLGTGGTQVSNLGLGSTEVNLNKLPGISVAITPTGANEAAGASGLVTITTALPHMFTVGQSVLINGVTVASYNGTFAITAVPSSTSFQYVNPTQNLAASGNGTAYSIVALNELQVLFNNKYGGPTGTAASTAAGAPITFSSKDVTGAPVARAGIWPSLIDFDSVDTTTGLSSKPLFTEFVTFPAPTAPDVAAGMNQTMFLQNTYGTSAGGGFPWSIAPGMVLRITDNPPLPAASRSESVTVISVDHVGKSFVANFAQPHQLSVNPNYTVHYGLRYRAFPNYPTGWDNQAANEITNNPLGLNLLNPTAPNTKPYPASYMEALLRFGGTNSPALTSNLFRLMPNTFGNTLAGQRTRNMVTPSSWHFDRIAAGPLAFDPRTALQYGYPGGNAGAPPNYPTYTGTIPGPVDYSNTAAPLALPPGAGGTEYGSDLRSVLGQKLRVNLNRPLRDFPLPTLAPNMVIDPANYALYTAALGDRTALAQDVYTALVRVTGALDPNNPSVISGMVTITPQQYKAARWLAQVAVNIVDYIDVDDYITPWQWNPNAATPSDGWVFGTELPRVVINEAYAQFDNDAAGMLTPTTAGSYRLNVWAELYNPFDATPTGSTYPLDGGSARLKIGTNSVYQLVVCGNNATLATNGATLSANMRDPGNNLGDPEFSNAAPVYTLATYGDWGPNPVVSPATLGNTIGSSVATIAASPTGATEAGNTVTITTTAAHGFTAGQVVTIAATADVGYLGTFTITTVPSTTTFTYTNYATAGLKPSGAGTATAAVGGTTGFFVVGPTPSFLPIPAAPVGASVRDPLLATTTATSTLSIPITAIAGGTPVPNYPTLVLRRLAVPHLPPNATPGALYNPYITVDYLDANPTIPIPDGRFFNETGAVAMAPAAVTTYQSYGRNQTYAAHVSQFSPQTPTTAPVASPQHTFFRQNKPHDITSDWLVQLDRQLINQIELRHVSGYKPHELTQQFIYPSAAIAAAPTGATEAGNTVTITTTGNHGLSVGQTVVISGVQVAGYNGYFTVTGVLSPTSFTYNPTTFPYNNPIAGLANSGGGAVSKKFQHRAPWTLKNSLLYRALDLLGTPNHMAGTFSGGRWPGNINLNTITEEEIFQALCDAQDDTQISPNYTRAQVTQIFQKLITSRNVPYGTPLPVALNPSPVPTSEGTPFQPFAASDYNTTWFRPDPTTGNSLLFAVGTQGDHSYRREALLQKIFNNITTTSNVFAVWWTVGFFQVVDESVRPQRLGAEIGRDQNRHIRHRFFAIVDRSGMQLLSTTSAAAVTVATTPQTLAVPFNAITSTTPNGKIAATWNPTQAYAVSDPVSLGGMIYLCTQANSNTTPPNTAFWVPYTLQPGMLLEIDTGATAEVVAVQAVDLVANTFTATFTQSHAANVPIVCRGNPGPQANYNPRRDNNVVLHLSVIK